jgi:hypothetical protein
LTCGKRREINAMITDLDLKRKTLPCTWSLPKKLFSNQRLDYNRMRWSKKEILLRDVRVSVKFLRPSGTFEKQKGPKSSVITLWKGNDPLPFA